MLGHGLVNQGRVFWGFILGALGFGQEKVSSRGNVIICIVERNQSLATLWSWTYWTRAAHWEVREEEGLGSGRP